MDENLNNDNEKTLLEIEREELNLLVQRGFHFDVIIGNRKKTFKIHEPTLNVLDRISDISLDMAISGDEMNQNDIILNARKLVKGNTKRQARIIAIAVLGESYYTNIPILRQILNVFYRLKSRSLTDSFMHTITPSKLVGLTVSITNISNLGDFYASMRLLSGARTTQPRRESIE